MDTDVDARGRQRLLVAVVVMVTTSSAAHLVDAYLDMGEWGFGCNDRSQTDTD